MKKFSWLRRDRAPVALLTMFVLGACSNDVPQQITESPRASVFTQGDPEREALRRLARGIAMGLGDSEFRKGVKSSMQKALFKEHKLELRKYLKGSALKAVAEASHTTTDAILADLALVRPLEFYMPVEAQRDAWTGGDDLLVVAGTEEEEAIIGFDLRGNEVAMAATQPPSVPTLAIVPQETDFDQPADSKKSINVDDQNGRTIGTLVSCNDPGNPCKSRSAVQSMKPSSFVACGETCGGGGGGGGYGTPGYYMTFSRIIDAKEPWWKGEPEIEVHVHAPPSAGYSQYGADLACSGEHVFNSERFFNQDDKFWNGSVLIIDKATDQIIVSQRSDGYHVIFWEDDSSPCQLKFNVDVVSNSVFAVVTAFGTAALKGGGLGTIGLVAGAFLAGSWQNKDWILGNDDLIGVLVPSTTYWDDGSNYTIMLGSSVNGRVRIDAK